MSSESVAMARLRAANPVPAVAIDAAELWTQITSSAGDPRLSGLRVRPQRARRWRDRASAHRGALLACGVMVAACGTAGVAGVTGIANFSLFARSKPLPLFRADLGFAPNPHAHVVPSSVRMVETVSVPTVGPVEYWVARTVSGWQCSAFKLPNGEWAGTTAVASNRYGFGGPVPSCHGPWITWEGPDFRYEQIWLGPVSYRRGRVVSGRSFAVVYGTVRASGTPVVVRDFVSGARAPVVSHGYFALVIPARLELDRSTPLGVPPGASRDANGYYIPYVRLEALDAAGRPVAIAPADHATFGP
jgi:hypothetical protein